MREVLQAAQSRAVASPENRFVTIGDIEEGQMIQHASPGDLRKAKQPAAGHLSLQKQDYAGAFGQRRDLSVPKQRTYQTNQELAGSPNLDFNGVATERSDQERQRV